jgi:hypothetical protein
MQVLNPQLVERFRQQRPTCAKTYRQIGERVRTRGLLK